ncbi:MAG: hypothetical protein RR232_00710 [Clostridia bacterium]
MRCSCRNCGTYMVQTEQGLSSGCKCPECFAVCRDCMGSVQKPLSAEQLSAMVLADITDDENEIITGSAEQTPGDWRRYL